MCALIKFGGGVAAISGTIGGTTFARNKGGAYARNWVSPVNPNTTKQQDRRGLFASLVSDWKALTKAQQAQWESASPNYPYVNRLGETSYYSGQALFMKLNSNLNAVNSANLVIPVIPVTFSTIAVGTLLMQLTASVLTTGTLTISAVGTASESLAVEITGPVSGGITKPAKGLFRQVYVSNDASSGTTLTFTSEYIALFGSPAVGANIFVRIYMVNETSGQRRDIGQTSIAVTTL
jgi:hypothetical protein